MTKRRLQLMPEVLPAPTRAEPSAVRTRTLARLRSLAAVGAAPETATPLATPGIADGVGASDADVDANEDPDPESNRALR